VVVDSPTVIAITASLALNVLVLVPVTAGLIVNARWADHAYGPASPARGILLSIYLAILAASFALIIQPERHMVVALLAVQVLYKITTPITARTSTNPVIISNLLIAAGHAITLWLIWEDGFAITQP
jgi:hypothetical protein